MWRVVWGKNGRGMARGFGWRVGDGAGSLGDAWVVDWEVSIMRGMAEFNRVNGEVSLVG